MLVRDVGICDVRCDGWARAAFWWKGSVILVYIPVSHLGSRSDAKVLRCANVLTYLLC